MRSLPVCAYRACQCTCSRAVHRGNMRMLLGNVVRIAPASHICPLVVARSLNHLAAQAWKKFLFLFASLPPYETKNPELNEICTVLIPIHIFYAFHTLLIASVRPTSFVSNSYQPQPTTKMARKLSQSATLRTIDTRHVGK